MAEFTASDLLIDETAIGPSGNDFESSINSITNRGNGSFKEGLNTLDLTKKGKRRVLRGYKKYQKAVAKGRDFTFNENGNFDVRNDENSRLAGSGVQKGNQVGFGAGDLIGLGNNVSYLAGALQDERNNRRLTQANDTSPLNVETIDNSGFDNLSDEITAGVDNNIAGPIAPKQGGKGSGGKGSGKTSIEEVELTPPNLDKYEFAITDQNSPGGFRTVTRYTRPTIIDENRGILAKTYPDLFQEFLDDDRDGGAVSGLIRDQENGRNGAISPDEYDERFRQWVVENNFDANTEFLGKGETFNTLNEFAPGRNAVPADFDKERNNFGDMVNAATLVAGIPIATKGVKGAKGAHDAAKIAVKYSDDLLKSGAVTKGAPKALGQNLGYNLAKYYNKLKSVVLSPAKKVGDDVVKGTKNIVRKKPKTSPKVAPKTAPKVNPPATTSTIGTKQPISKVMQNSTIKKSYTSDKLTKEINDFIAKNPAAKQMNLSNGSRVKLVNGSWKLFASGGKITASNLIR